jgi:hypothetical protein
MLVPTYIEALLPDPFSTSGFGYHLVNEDVYGRSYLLYSVGRDGEDNDGRPRQDFPSGLKRPDDEPSYDIIFNRPRPAYE